MESLASGTSSVGWSLIGGLWICEVTLGFRLKIPWAPPALQGAPSHHISSAARKTAPAHLSYSSGTTLPRLQSLNGLIQQASFKCFTSRVSPQNAAKASC